MDQNLKQFINKYVKIVYDDADKVTAYAATLLNADKKFITIRLDAGNQIVLNLDRIIKISLKDTGESNG